MKDVHSSGRKDSTPPSSTPPDTSTTLFRRRVSVIIPDGRSTAVFRYKNMYKNRRYRPCTSTCELTCERDCSSDWVRRSPDATLVSSTAVDPHGRATFRAQRPRGPNLRDPTSVLCQFHCPSSGADSRAQSGSSTLTSSPKRCLIALSKPPLLGVGHEPLGSL